MVWAALREAKTDLFMHAPIDEVTRHLSREFGDVIDLDGPAERPTGYPAAFSFDPVSIARPLSATRFTSF